MPTVAEQITELKRIVAGGEQAVARALANGDIVFLPELEGLPAWWRERQAALQQANDASRETERITFHVERRWVDAIRRQADYDHLTITQVVNEAFRQHFKGK